MRINPVNKNIVIQSIILTCDGISQPMILDAPYLFKNDAGQYLIPEYNLIYEEPQPGQAQEKD
jgi:hypothetical protein